jgi:hypothetical protein
MSLSQTGESWVEGDALRWIGYGFGVAGVAAAIMRAFQPGPLWTSLLLLSAAVTLGVMVRAPETFEILYRGGKRGPNLLVGAPSAFLFFSGLGQQVDDVSFPVAGAAVAAAVLLVATTRVMDRPGLMAPLTFQIMAALLAAGLGYGAVVALDVDYDLSMPTVLPLQVLGKYAQGSRSTTYHLRVPPFGDRPAQSSVTVKYGAYAALHPGDVVCVLEHRGAIGLPWISARLCDR